MSVPASRGWRNGPRRPQAPQITTAHAQGSRDGQLSLPVRERIERLLDPDSPFLELSPLAAGGMYDNEAPGSGLTPKARSPVVADWTVAHQTTNDGDVKRKTGTVTIAAGATVSGIGFNASYSGTNPAPPAFSVNGTLCK